MSRASYSPPALRDVEAEWYSCPHCHRVCQGLFRLEWCRGFVAFDPTLICASCLGALREEERAGEIWDLRIISMSGAPLAPRRLVLA